MIVAVVVFCYLVAIGIAGGITAYVTRLNSDHDEAAILTVLLGVFWPATIIGALIVAILWLTLKACQVLGHRIGLRLNKSKITASTVRMMEDDLARVGGSQELMLNWDYRPCRSCYGSGCRNCHDTGVVRVKDGVAVTRYG